MSNIYYGYQGVLKINDEVVGYCREVRFQSTNNSDVIYVLNSRIPVIRERGLGVTGSIGRLVIDGSLLAEVLGYESFDGHFIATLHNDGRIGIRLSKRQRNTDSYFEVYGNRMLAQSFTATGNAKGIAVYCYKEGSPSAASVEIQTDDSDKPSGTAASNSNVNILSQLNTSPSWCGDDYANTVSLTAGNKYWIVVKATGDASNSVYAGYYSDSDKFLDGACKETTDGANWNAKLYDMAFWIHMETTSPTDVKIELVHGASNVKYTINNVKFDGINVTATSDGVVEESVDFTAESVSATYA